MFIMTQCEQQSKVTKIELFCENCLSRWYGKPYYDRTCPFCGYDSVTEEWPDVRLYHGGIK